MARRSWPRVSATLLELVRRQRLAKAACAAVVVGACIVGTVSAQSGPIVPVAIMQGSEGTLYLIAGAWKYELVPDPISDQDLGALQEGGSIAGSQLIFASQVPAAGGANAQQAPTAQPAAAPAPTPQPRQPVTVTESMHQSLEGSSQPFTLASGNYTVTWTAAGSTGTSGGVSLTNQPGVRVLSTEISLELIPTANGLSGRQQIANVQVAVGQTLHGSYQLSNVVAGQYQMAIEDLMAGGAVSADCSITFTPA